MKVSAISKVSSDEDSRRNLFITFSNSYMSAPVIENPVEQTSKRPAKMGIENLEEFTIYPKEVKDGRTVITA